ncbi:MAG: cation transporter [Candidatus Nanoarchaeia archaeon]
MGQSNTINADFLRRGVEFLSILASWIVFLIINKKTLSPSAVKKLESFSSLLITTVMLISFVFISYKAYTEFIEPSETGWLLPGILIALIALVNNSYFWRWFQAGGCNKRKIFQAKSC